ncbi:sensor histidine kinase [Paractinoplanes rishiriensis]|uniref:histidine kinase n=1 Tax=Paractinoplanes rishiriensis TaxID=1050105 RepID=A0A919JY05_9ACTN|nr:ATP-binding protein [Actinoplanes rishiriensis]GIE95314.1 hypothetical protein Ari01nite_27790 [Actinoplanes rishiriensis]
MADLGRASVRLRTTAAAVLVVAVALLAGSVTLVLLVRASLRDGVEASAEQRASVLAAQVDSAGLPAPDDSDGSEEGDDDDDLLWHISDKSGQIIRASGPLGAALRSGGEGGDGESGGGEVTAGGQRYLVVTEDADDYDILVAASLEDVDESTAALVTPLAAGVPLMLLLVGGTTWMVVTRALTPVERIRREVEEITGDRLDRRVPEPASRDEIHRLAKTMNQMLIRLQDARERQQQFVADASHELRSPLASIRQAAEIAGAHPGALPEGELAEAVLEESGRMQRLVEQLLLLTHTGVVSSPRQDLDLDDLALAEARRVGRSGLVVDTSGVGGGRVRGDATALAQVVRNLVDNAARHASARIAVAVREAPGGVVLSVEDDGRGIPPDQRERVFERFVRLDEARARDAGGSGLGLAIVKETVVAHGGTVTVGESALGGARFEVCLKADSASFR